MTRYRFGLTALFFGAVAVMAGGCGPRFTFVPVEGTVTKGGRPLRGMEVIFLADPDSGTVGPRATGRTDEAGHYRLRTERGDDGAVAGIHRVLVLDLEAALRQMMGNFHGQPRTDATRLPPEAAKRPGEQRKAAGDAPRAPPDYMSINDTPLRAEVGSGPLVFDVVVP
jgi:hypothetical protein